MKLLTPQQLALSAGISRQGIAPYNRELVRIGLAEVRIDPHTGNRRHMYKPEAAEWFGQEKTDYLARIKSEKKALREFKKKLPGLVLKDLFDGQSVQHAGVLPYTIDRDDGIFLPVVQHWIEKNFDIQICCDKKTKYDVMVLSAMLDSSLQLLTKMDDDEAFLTTCQAWVESVTPWVAGQIKKRYSVFQTEYKTAEAKLFRS